MGPAVGRSGMRPATSPPPHASPAFDAELVVDGDGRRWHCRLQGEGPCILLLHGTGSASHSWAGLAPLLAARGFRVVAPDLPGHGRTEALKPGPSSLPAMADALRSLLERLDLAPQAVLGHSAGAALSAWWALEQPASALRQLVWIAGALRPLPGLAGRWGPPLARWMARSPWVPRLAAWHARDDDAVQRLIASTGSRLDEEGVRAYASLWRQPEHVAGTLAMMAGWDLAPLQPRLRQLAVPVLWLHGTSDRTIAPAEAEAVCRELPDARVERLQGLGHLAHEQAPQAVAAIVAEAISAAAARCR